MGHRVMLMHLVTMFKTLLVLVDNYHQLTVF